MAYYTSRGNGCFAYRLSQASKCSDVHSTCWNFHADAQADRYGYSHAHADGHTSPDRDGYTSPNRDGYAKAHTADCYAKAHRDCHAKTHRHCHAETDGDTKPNGCADQHQHSLVCADR